jgi:hypothetical protein
MGRSLQGCLAVGLAVAGLGAAAHAQDADLGELRAQMQQMQQRINELEARQVASRDVDATVEAVLRDADRRSQVLQMEGFTAGYSKGKFLLQSADGNFVMHPFLQFQFRSVTDFRDGADGGGDDDIQNGFEVRRLKFGWDGNVFSPNLKYQFQFQTDRRSGSPSLEDAWLNYQFADQWSVIFGQFKGQTFREGMVSSMRQLAADRSLLNSLLEGNDNYLQGVGLIYDPTDRMKIQFGITDGFGSANTNFQDPPTNPFDFGVNGRIDVQLMGEKFKGYQDFTAIGNNGSDLLVVGAAFDWSQNGDVDQILHTVDAQWEPGAIRGLAVSGAYAGRYAQFDGAGGDDNSYDWGVLAQAGYLLNDKLEVFGRYDLTDFDDTTAGGDSFSEITGGVNYYFSHDHATKFTLDLSYLPDGCPSDQTGLGFLASNDDQIVLRGQFQLLL